MKKILYALACTILITVACGTSSTATAPAFDPNMMQTVIAGTALVAQNQTQTASVPIGIPITTNTMLPTDTPLTTETPLGPLSRVYEGLTINCICNNCGCITSVVFTARITIDAQGYVTGSLDKYLPDAPAMIFEGTKANLLGSIQEDKDVYQFTGSLSENLSTLDATLSFEGTNDDDTLYSGKRVLLLFKK